MFNWLYNKYVRFGILVSAFFAGNNHFSTSIYQGWGKRIFFPGLNCYSCPLARFSCPLGTLQNFIGIKAFPFYVLGFLGLVGITVGRLVCGWVCPFGFFQELLYKLRTFKIRVPEKYSYSKYLVLFVFAIIIPFLTAEPWFCNLCPAGGIEAGIPLVAFDSYIRSLVGSFFYVKMAIVGMFLSASILIKRPFCRFGCPLGAIYGIFNKFTFFRIQVDQNKCTKCYACQDVCPMDIEIFKVPDSADCIRCGLCIKACPTNALSFKYGLYSRLENSSKDVK